MPPTDTILDTNKAGLSTKESFDSGCGADEKWRILLIELIHLLGLFLIHTRQSKSARATAIIFDQFVRHLDILERMPGHDGAMTIRRISRNKIEAGIEKPDYVLLFGNLIIESISAIDSTSDMRRRAAHMFSALNQAYGCLAEQGIHALCLQFPGRSSERIDQLRYALNIVARFHQTVEQGAAIITFRYFGRALTIPLVRDSFGLPDPNLTLVAGLNGLSGRNAKELVRQAEAYCGLGECKDLPPGPINIYDRIFSVRSLRSQLIRPLVEINSLPWMQARENAISLELPPAQKQFAGTPPPDVFLAENGNTSEACITLVDLIDPPITKQQLMKFVEGNDHVAQSILTDLFDNDFPAAEAPDLARQFVGITKLLFALDKSPNAHSVSEKFLLFIHSRLECIPDFRMQSIDAQKQRIRIVYKKRAIIVGMVHPRLFELIVLLQERIHTYQKIAALQSYTFEFERCDKLGLAERFGVSEAAIGHVLDLLHASIDAKGIFNRTAFDKKMPQMVQYESLLFEMLWCVLKQAPSRENRLALVQAMQHVMARLVEPKNALRFLMADLFYDPFQINFADRNAFVLSTLLLHEHDKELTVNIDTTPDEVLKPKKGINLHARHYAAWRLDIDQVRILTKLRTLRDRIRRAIIMPAESENPACSAGFLLALERESFIFLALVGGRIARIALRGALALYGNPQSDIYCGQSPGRYQPLLMDHLAIAVRVVGRIGRLKDLEALKALEQAAPRLNTLQSGSDHALKVNQVIKWVAPAMRMIQLRSR